MLDSKTELCLVKVKKYKVNTCILKTCTFGEKLEKQEKDQKKKNWVHNDINFGCHLRNPFIRVMGLINEY